MIRREEGTMPLEMLKIGQICGTHGVRGEMNVLPLTDDPRRFSKLTTVHVLDASGKVLAQPRVEGVKYAKNKVIVKLEGISDMDAVRPYTSAFLAVTRDHAVKLPRDSYFVCDLIGCVVSDEQGVEWGPVVDVLQTGANDVYVVRRDGFKDLLIPAIRSVVLEVDIDAGRIVVRLPDGLLEL
jgi:16S rRNA processing protein RimM